MIKDIYQEFKGSFSKLYQSIIDNVTRKEYYFGATTIYKGFYTDFLSLKIQNSEKLKGQFVESCDNYNYEYFFNNSKLIGYVKKELKDLLYGFILEYGNYQLTLEFVKDPQSINDYYIHTIILVKYNELLPLKVVIFNDIEDYNNYVDSKFVIVEEYQYKDNILISSTYKYFNDIFKLDPQINLEYFYTYNDSKYELKEYKDLSNSVIKSTNTLKITDKNIKKKYLKLFDKGLSIYLEHINSYKSYKDSLSENTFNTIIGTSTNLLKDIDLLYKELPILDTYVKVYYDKQNQIIGFEQKNDYLFNIDEANFSNNITFIRDIFNAKQLLRYVFYDNQWILEKITILKTKDDLITECIIFDILNSDDNEIVIKKYSYKNKLLKNITIEEYLNSNNDVYVFKTVMNINENIKKVEKQIIL